MADVGMPQNIRIRAIRAPSSARQTDRARMALAAAGGMRVVGAQSARLRPSSARPCVVARAVRKIRLGQQSGPWIGTLGDLHRSLWLPASGPAPGAWLMARGRA